MNGLPRELVRLLVLAGDAEPRTMDYCARCGESPESATHVFGNHTYVDPRPLYFAYRMGERAGLEQAASYLEGRDRGGCVDGLADKIGSMGSDRKGHGHGPGDGGDT